MPQRDEPSGPAWPLRLEVVVFHTSDPGPALQAWRTGRAGDVALFEELSRLETEGRAERSLETRLSAVGGRWLRSEAVREFIYPTEFEPFASPVSMAPVAFETRNLGESLGLIARARASATWRFDAKIETTRCEGFSQWPFVVLEPPATGPRSSLIRMPVTLWEKVTTVTPAPAGRPVLLGCGLLAPALAEEPSKRVGESPPMQFTFLRAEPVETSTPAATAPPAESDAARLHLRHFRVPRHLAAAWLWERTGEDDAADLDHWERAVAEGTATASFHAAVETATGPVTPGGPPKASVEAMTEFIYPTEWELSTKPERPYLLPTAYETRLTGRSFTAQATWARDGRTLLAEVADEQVRLLDLVSWPVSPDDPALSEDVPHFGQESFRAAVSVPEGGVRFVGARPVLPGGEGHEGGLYAQVDLLFLQASRRDASLRDAASKAPAAPRVIETQVFVFSLPAEAANAFAGTDEEGVDSTARVEELWTLAETGEARVWLALATTGSAGGTSEVRSSCESIYPTEISPHLLDRRLIGYTAFETFDHGTQLEAAIPGDPTQPVQVTLHWETALPVRPTWTDYERVVKEKSDDIPFPFFFMRELSASVPLGRARVMGVVTAPADTPDPPPWPTANTGTPIAPAPAGTPEHGRVHIVVGRCMAHPAP